MAQFYVKPFSLFDGINSDLSGIRDSISNIQTTTTIQSASTSGNIVSYPRGFEPSQFTQNVGGLPLQDPAILAYQINQTNHHRVQYNKPRLSIFREVTSQDPKL